MSVYLHVEIKRREHAEVERVKGGRRRAYTYISRVHVYIAYTARERLHVVYRVYIAYISRVHVYIAYTALERLHVVGAMEAVGEEEEEEAAAVGEEEEEEDE